MPGMLSVIPKRVAEIYPQYRAFQAEQHERVSLAARVHWERLRGRFESPDDAQPGLCINLLCFPPSYLRVFITQFHPEGIRRLHQDDGLQQAIAHAYWQTVWAGDAIRRQQGDTEPVAFLPVHRRLYQADSPRWGRIHQIGPGRAIIGTENWAWWVLSHAVQQGRLSYHTEHGFKMDEPLKPDLRRLLDRVFVDRFIGQNRALRGRVPVKKIVPVAGSHLLTRLAGGEARHFAADALLAEKRPLAATNSLFFLNFPEEYLSLWDAMNDPVGLLIDHAKMFQLPLMARGTLLVDNRNRSRLAVVSMQDIRMRLPWEKDWRGPGTRRPMPVDAPDLAGKETVLFTPAYLAGLPPQERRTPVGEVVDLVIVFGRIVEVKAGGQSSIPNSGFVLSMPAATLEYDAALRRIAQYGPVTQFALDHQKFNLETVRTALSVGPILLHGNRLISEDYFHRGAGEEQFEPCRREGENLQTCGLPPSRFPHDVTATRAPRTILGIRPDGDLVLAVIDGRVEHHSVGMTLKEAARFLKTLGCHDGLNLDGGGSSIMYVHPSSQIEPVAEGLQPGIVNLPSDHGHQERLMPAPLWILAEG